MVTATACGLGACRSYAPEPLDRAADRAAWHARTLEAASLRGFLDRVDPERVDDLADFDPSDGLTVREGGLVALAYNASLRLERLRVEGAAAEAQEVPGWQDPTLSIDALRIAEDVPDRWVISAGLELAIPLSDRRDAARDLARATVGAERCGLVEAEWRVWHETVRAWIEWSADALAREETARLVRAVEEFLPEIARLAELGELAPGEAALFEIEAEELRNAQRGRDARLAAAEHRLRGRLGLPPETPLDLVPTLEPPLSDALREARDLDRIEARNPALARLRREYDVAEESLRLEVERRLPDLILGPLFESDEGQSRVGLLAGVPLPAFDGNRQAIARARAARAVARAAVEVEYERLVAEHAASTARLVALGAQRRGLEDVLVPLLEDQLERTIALQRIGEGSSLVLLETLTRAHRAKLDLIATRAAEALERTHLADLLGPTVHDDPGGEETR